MFKGKKALITGAAGDIGHEVARRLNDLNYQLILVDINDAKLKEIATEFSDPVVLTVDLTDREQLRAFTEELRVNHNDIDVAFVNAGVVCVGELVDLPEEKIDLQLELNLRSSIHLIKACVTPMLNRGSGHIISTVSLGGIISLKGSSIYSATKFGLRGFLTAIRDELKPHGVAVTGIYPSSVDTDMLKYEARHGGSALNFISPPQTVEQVAGAVIKSLRTKPLEVYLPYSESISARLVSVFPWSLDYLYPILEKAGQKGLKKYLSKIGR